MAFRVEDAGARGIGPLSRGNLPALWPLPDQATSHYAEHRTMHWYGHG